MSENGTGIHPEIQAPKFSGLLEPFQFQRTISLGEEILLCDPCLVSECERLRSRRRYLDLQSNFILALDDLLREEASRVGSGTEMIHDRIGYVISAFLDVSPIHGPRRV